MCGPHGLPGAANVLYHNDGDGTYSDASERTGVVDPSKYYGLGSVWGDIDNDGDLDLYVADDATPNLLYVNQGGRFSEEGFPSGLALSGAGLAQAGMGVDMADYDNDGLLDVYCTHFAGDYSTLYHNEGGGFFEDVTAKAGILTPDLPFVKWGTRFVDLNNDGWKDIFHTNGHTYPSLDREPMDMDDTYRQPQSLYLNLGNGKFLDASRLAGPALREPHVGRGAAFADFDNDGDIDIAVAQMNGGPLLFRNDQSSANHWVMFRTVGRTSNRDGIGARLTIVAGGLRQIWEIKRTVAIYSCSDPRAHFGLGSAARIERLEVRWPGGKVQEFADIPADRHYLVDEESGLSEERFGPVAGASASTRR